MKTIPVELKVIGEIHSKYKTTKQAPRQGNDEVCEIEIYEEFAKGLTDIEGFSHLHIFYWLDKSQRYNLMVQTPWDTTPHGLFTTRSPHRPNALAFTTVELTQRKDNILIVKGLDAIDKTPVIDIKPYIKKVDIKTDAVSGWLEKRYLKND